MSDLATLFATDPLNLTDDDIDAIVKAYAERRNQFKLTGKAPTKAMKEADAETREAVKSIDLGSLGL